MNSKVQRNTVRRGDDDSGSDPGSDLSSDPGGDLDREIQAPLSHEASRDLASEQGDPVTVSGGEVEVWFDAEELARSSSVELVEDEVDGEREQATPQAPSVLTRAPRAQQLLEGLAGPSVSLARLPGWPDAGDSGQGLGEVAAALVGELRPGQVLLWTGRERSVGRTSLLAQLGDGLALREQPGQPVTPVVFVSERGAATWRARSLARWSGLAPETFIDPGRARARASLATQLEAFERSAWSRLHTHQRFVRAQAFGAIRRTQLLAELQAWRAELASDPSSADPSSADPSSAAEVWPVLIVDPLEALGDELLTELTELGELAQREQLVVLASCDAPQSSRVSRLIDRHVHARLLVERCTESLELELLHSPLAARGRTRLAFDASCGRTRGDPDA